jgi:hypothetical protein
MKDIQGLGMWNFDQSLLLRGVPKNRHLAIFGEIFFLQNDSLGIFLCEKSIACIENP